MGLVAVGLLPLSSTAQQAPPANILFLLDNSESMQDFPVYLPEDFTPGFYPNPSNPKPGDLGGDGPAGYFINTGCTDPRLVAAMGWFDKNSSIPSENGSIPYDEDEGLNSRFFDASRFYHARGRRLAWEVAEAPYSLFSDFRTLDSSSASFDICYQVAGWKDPYFYSPVMEECQRCLATKGWWRGPLVSAKTVSPFNTPVRAPTEPPLPPEAFRKWVVSGGVLNLRPPRFVLARKELKNILTRTMGARMGVATFGSRYGAAAFDPPEMLSTLRPGCDKSFPTIDETALDRTALKQSVNWVSFRNAARPLGEALFGLGGYFSSQRADQRWSNWFQQPLSPGAFGWPGCCDGGTFNNPYTGASGSAWGAAADEWLKPWKISDEGVYLPGQPWEAFDPNQRSVCQADQANAVIVVTGGTPRWDNTVPITRMMQLLVQAGARHRDGSLVTFDPSSPGTNPNPGGVNYCDQFQNGWGQPYTKEVCDYTEYNWPTGLARTNKNFMDDVAFFLSHTDLRGELPGSQKLRTSILHFDPSGSTASSDLPLLKSVALAGEGRYFRPSNLGELRQMFVEAIDLSRTPLPAGVPSPVPDNVMVLVDNHKSMQDYPEPLPEVFTPGDSRAPSNAAPGELGSDGPGGLFLNTGCTDPALVQAMSWYDKNSPSMKKNGSIPYDADEGLASRFFEPSGFYQSRGRRLAWQPEDNPSVLSSDFKRLDPDSSALNACHRVVDGQAAYIDSQVINECVRCLEQKGWWRGPLVSERTSSALKNPVRALDEPPLPPEAYRRWVVRGGVLNLRPPKFVIIRKVLKDLIASTTGTRLGLATFGREQGGYDPPELLSGMRPLCDAAGKGQPLPDADQTAMRQAVNNLSFQNKERSTGEALFGLGGYFSSQLREQRWENWFKQPLSPGFFGWPGCCNGGTYDSPYTTEQGAGWGAASNEWIKPPTLVRGAYLPGQPWESTNLQERLYCSAEQRSSVVVLTGGRPFSDNTVPITRMMQLLIQAGARHPDGSLLRFDPSLPERNPSVGGVNYCDAFGATKGDCDYTDYNWPTGLGAGNKNFMDDVTFFLARMDLRGELPGRQSLRTSIVNFAGPDSPMLHSMARAGEGWSLRAQTPEELRAALESAVSSFGKREPGITPSSRPAGPSDP
jgi:hypothetical protein